MAANDCTWLCLLASFALGTPEGARAFLNVMNARFGTQLVQEDITALGIKVIKEELEFNRKAGITKEDDRLPEFFYKEPLPPHNKVVMISTEEIDSALKFD